MRLIFGNLQLPESKSMMTKIEIKDAVEVNVAEYVPPERPPLSTCEFVVGPQAPKCRECIPGYFCGARTVLCGECFILQLLSLSSLLQTHLLLMPPSH